MNLKAFLFIMYTNLVRWIIFSHCKLWFSASLLFAVYVKLEVY